MTCILVLPQHRYVPRVEAALSTGVQRGLRGSPVLGVHGARLDGVPRLQTLMEYVEVVLAAQAATQPERREP